ncbi:MAG: hypothetical protein ACYC6X_00395 [Minisyncoccota bacterium]
MEEFKQPKGENQPEYKRNEVLAKQFEQTEKYEYGSTIIEAFDVQPEKLKKKPRCSLVPVGPPHVACMRQEFSALRTEAGGFSQCLPRME